MAFKYQTTKKVESQLFPGVFYTLRKMTEGRRLELRQQLRDANQRLREIMREQGEIMRLPEEQQDVPKMIELQEQFDEIMLETMNPTWVKWGVKMLEGLEVDDRPLGLEDWKEWPSALMAEIVEAVKAEAELNGAERKNLESPTISGALVGTSQNPSTAPSADEKDSGEVETAENTSQIM